ncbi:MAG TPA: oxygenase MpaB family protein [Solirubrobacterales bacterium]|nr:oxygenase MpaB family protein [Solirubrobacterales bacterium]
MAVEVAPPIPTALPNAAAALARYGEFGQLWLDGMWRGDPLADAVVADGALQVRRVLANGIDAVDDPPAALVELFAELDARPAWMDPDRCDRAATHLVRQAREYGLVLGAASLVAGAQNSIAGMPLTFTGRYAGDAAMRSIEVGSWLTAVLTPGGLERRGGGFERTVRVRMIHAHIRSHLQRSPKWEMAAWGLPIPQPYMAFTLAEFCSIALRAMHQVGARFSDAELEDIHHLWRCTGHLVGVEEALLPVEAGDYERVEALYALTSPGADVGDRVFVRALSEFQAVELARYLPARWTPGIVRGQQRAFVGAAVADDLAIPDSRWKHLPQVLGPLTAAGYRAHDSLVPGGRKRRTARAFRNRDRELARLRTEYSVDHEMVDDAA